MFRLQQISITFWVRVARDYPDVQEEHAEYVRSMATLSAVMAGFVNIALIQFDFDARDMPIVVLMGFGITNAITVGSL